MCRRVKVKPHNTHMGIENKGDLVNYEISLAYFASLTRVLVCCWADKKNYTAVFWLAIITFFCEWNTYENKFPIKQMSKHQWEVSCWYFVLKRLLQELGTSYLSTFISRHNFLFKCNVQFPSISRQISIKLNKNAYFIPSIWILLKTLLEASFFHGILVKTLSITVASLHEKKEKSGMNAYYGWDALVIFILQKKE